MNNLCAKWTLVSKRGAILLDRDGVIIQDKGYVNSIEQTVFLPEAIEAIKFAKSSGFLVFVVTNQAGVAREFFSEVECRDYNLWLLQELARMSAQVDELVYCPSHPDYSKRPDLCICRKPNSGMLDYLITKWQLDKENSLIIGDKQSDCDAGAKAGIHAKLITSPEEILDAVKDFSTNHVAFGTFNINSHS
jgi:D-glycero-D-manno-heptose 1,7-bisphosphate phosphatase